MSQAQWWAAVCTAAIVLLTAATAGALLSVTATVVGATLTLSIACLIWHAFDLYGKRGGDFRSIFTSAVVALLVGVLLHIYEKTPVMWLGVLAVVSLGGLIALIKWRDVIAPPPQCGGGSE